MSGPFFVGGTGRCGTSQLCRVLGDHPEVHALEWESRFLVDPGGFEDLAWALTAAYTPYHADDALGRLAWLLNERLTGNSREAFRGWGLADQHAIGVKVAVTGPGFRLRVVDGSPYSTQHTAPEYTASGGKVLMLRGAHRLDRVRCVQDSGRDGPQDVTEGGS